MITVEDKREAELFVDNFYEVFKELVSCDELSEIPFEEITMASPISGVASMHCGATKGVVCPYDYNFVIKVPFSYNDCDDCYYKENYCELEYENYQLAKKYHVEDFFAAIDVVANIKGINIYVQEKAKSKCFTFYDDEDSHYGTDIVDKTFGRNASDVISDFFIAECLKCYPAEKVIDFLIFLDDNEDKFNDVCSLHNVSLTEDEKPVIIDYSGYWD